MRRYALLFAIGVALALAALASAKEFQPWATAVNAESLPGTDSTLNTAALEGCPAVSRDGKSLYFASNRAGGLGMRDIYVAHRAAVGDPWGAPENVGAPVNTSADEFCPSPTRDGHGFLFISTRPGGCGGADIYATRQSQQGWAAPANLGCDVNSAADEAGPFLLPLDSGTVLYFSSTRTGNSDIYVAPVADNGTVGTPSPATELNTSYSDARPNLRRDGLEIFFDSDRPGGQGSADLWTATRSSTDAAWSTPTNLGASVNSTAADLRPSLSWDATTLYFGSTRAGGEGSSDLYVTTREKAHG
jgi:Tol biopolymer transport system component